MTSHSHQDDTRARRRRRAKYLLWSLPVLVVLLYLAVRLIGLSVVNQTAIDLYDSGLYEASEDRSTSLLDQRVIEPYLPWFNRGDAKAAQEEYTDAIDDFERALELAPADRQCDVRVNLALSWERLGDIYSAAGFPDGAKQLYEASLAVIAEGEDCVPPEPAGLDLSEAGPRVQAKIDQAEQQAQAADPGGDTESGGLDQQLDELGQKGQAGEQDLQNGESLDRGENGQDGGVPLKPW
jgi:tetratricopeptide (TPR) repeat protein